MVATLVLALEAIGFSTAVATFAVNFALSYVVTRMFADNPEKQQDMGVRQQVPPSAVNAIPIVYGDAYMGGTFVDAVLSTDQKTMYYVLAISSISPNGQFTFDTSNMYFGDRKITFDSTDLTKVVSLTDEAGNVNTKIGGNLYINLYTSTASGVITSANGASAPSVVMGGSDIDSAQRWPSTNRQMNGLGFAIVKLVYNRDADTTQLSPITFHVSHTLNGTGVAKAGDVWYDYITNPVYGGAVDSAFVNSSSATVLNTYGDELITFTDSSGNPSTQPRYRINGVLDAGQSVLSNIDRIVSACDSWMTYNAALGQWSIVVNKAESTSYAFNDNNIVGEIRVSATDITSSINQVEARFPFKNNRDQAAFVNIETPSGLLYPNEPVNKYSITYDMVNDSVQAHYLANRLLEQAREDLIVGFNTTYYGIQVNAGDVVSVTNADYGWNAKLFRVMKVNEASLADGNLGARLELSEYNAAVYDNADITQFSPVPNSNLPSVNYFSPLSAPTITSSNPSSAIPNFNVQISIPAVGRVTIGELYYTTSATPTANDWTLLSTAGRIDGEPVTPSTYYTFQNQVLPTGASTTATYYFSYIVGNDIARSNKSPTSAAFTWTPVNGANGTRTAILDMYQWAATAPTTFPVGVSVYTWATGQFTAPATPNGWSLTPPASVSGQTLWIARTIYTDTATTATSNVTWSATTAYAVGAAGENGTRTAFLELYRWSASTPTTFPSGNSTYTWATGAFTAPSTLNGWSLTPPAAVTGYTLYGCSVRYADSLTTATSTVPWTTSTAYAVGAAGTNGTNGTDGTNGLNGLNFINAYKVQSQSASTPTFSATTSGSTIPSGWTGTAPSVAVGQVMWYIQGRYNSTSSTIDGVSPNTTAWTGPIAASIFQDIRSDNWNGSTPPVAATPSTWGTDGYYISRTDGNMYANGFYARGKMIINGTNGDLLNTGLKVNQTGLADIGVYGYAGGTTAGRGIVGVANVINGVGVFGTASGAGGISTQAGVTAFATDGATTALNVVGGKIQIDNTAIVNNLNVQYLNSKESSAFVQVASGTTNNKYLYYVNNTGAPTNPTTRAAWILISTNDGGTVYIPGYV